MDLDPGSPFRVSESRRNFGAAAVKNHTRNSKVTFPVHKALYIAAIINISPCAIDVWKNFSIIIRRHLAPKRRL